MSVHHEDWAELFRRCYEHAVASYRQGQREAGHCFTAVETAFLASIGCTPQEVYDFAEDWCVSDAPPYSTVLLITAVRRDFFRTVQRGQSSAHRVALTDLPAKTAVVAGYAWLPRLIAKGRAKLRGEMPPDLMYGCGGDRAFFQSVRVHPADFLRVVWTAGEDDQQIIEYVRHQASAPAGDYGTVVCPPVM